jgi:DNA-directed RNA polymerase subunit RPC12/RpoP
MNTPHAHERYRCNDCRNNFHLLDVNKTWKCPECSKPVNIRVEIDNYFHNAHRLNPEELEIGTIMTMDRENIHEILNVTPLENNRFRLALGNYGVRTFRKDDWIFVIDGSWTDYGF